MRVVSVGSSTKLRSDPYFKLFRGCSDIESPCNRHVLDSYAGRLHGAGHDYTNLGLSLLVRRGSTPTV